MDTPAQKLVARHSPPKVVAHRGASLDAPENTVAAYRASVALGAHAHETDVHLSRDGRVVVMHDETVDRTTNGTGAIADLTYDGICTLDAGAWFHDRFRGEPVPALEDVLAATVGSVLIVEIKRGDGIVEAMVPLVAPRRGDLVIFSFDEDALRSCARHLPDVPTVLLCHRETHDYGAQDVEAATKVHARALGFDHRRIDAHVVDVAHAAGLPVFAWTANEAKDILRLAEIGVDLVITDAVALALSLL